MAIQNLNLFSLDSAESLESFRIFTESPCDSAFSKIFAILWIASAINRLAKTVKGNPSLRSILKKCCGNKNISNVVIARLDKVKSWRALRSNSPILANLFFKVAGFCGLCRILLRFYTNTILSSPIMASARAFLSICRFSITIMLS